MPTSGWHKIHHVMGVLQHVPDPRTVLDVGVGFGKFGLLFREHLDIRKRRYGRAEWLARIDGVEAWANYATPIHDFIYNQVLYGDVRSLVDNLPSYDLIVLADVIEHMPYEDGTKLLRTLFEGHCRRGMVVSYPNVIGSDWKRWENPHEQHHCVWKAEHFAVLFPEARVLFSTPQVAYILKEN